METCKQIFLKIFMLVFVIVGTTSIIYYAKGYRVNLQDQKIITTGVLNIETQPRRANFYLTENFQGRTPKTISSIPDGVYELNLWLEDYHDLKYKIEIIAERSTPISAFLFKKNPEFETIDEIENEIVSVIKHSNNDIFYLTREQNDDEFEYDLYKYETSTRFWEFGENPKIVFSFKTELDEDIENLVLSPNTSFAFLDIEGKERQILSLDKQEILATLEYTDITPIWSEDSMYIVWQEGTKILQSHIEDPEDIVTIYTERRNTSLINYNTDSKGELYILYEDSDNDVSLVKINSRNEEELEVLENIYYRENERFLNTWKEIDTVNYQPFKSSPESTLFVGKPIEFSISLETNSIIFTTEYAIYRYDIEQDRYLLLNPHPSQFLEFSPDERKLSFLDLENNRLGVFIFDRETGNRSVRLGGFYSAQNIDIQACTDFLWHENSLNIYYACDNTLYVTDVHGFNNLLLTENWGEYTLLQNNNRVATIIKEENSAVILEAIIN